MKVSSVLFFCVISIVGSYHASNAASISKRAEGESTSSSDSGSVAALRTVDDVTDVIHSVFRTLSQFGPIRLIGEALGLPLDILLTPILDALGTILIPVRELLSKSLYSLAPALNEILIQLGRLLGELLDHVADTLDPDSSFASASTSTASSSSSSSSSTAASSSSPSSLSSSSSSDGHRRRRRSFANIIPLAIANLLHMPAGSTVVSSSNDLISILTNLFDCGQSPMDKLPSGNEITTNPAQGLKTILCFLIYRVANVSEGMVDRLIPAAMEALKNINETGIVPPPISTYINMLVMLYEMSSALKSGR